jgi:hypothetical protein
LRPHALAAALVAALAAVLSAWIAVRAADPSAFNQDVGWILIAAERVLDGADYGRDWLDANPPGIFWLSAAPVAIARAVGAPPIAVFDGLVALAELASLAAFHRILARGWPELAAETRLALCGLIGAALTLLPGYDFGQREHLVAIAALPYWLAGARALAGRPLGWRAGLAVGAAAGVGFAIKPFFLLAWAAVEAWIARERGARATARAENAAIAGIAVVCAGAVALLTPGYRDVAALAWQVLGAYDYPWYAFVLNRAALVLAVALAAARSIRPTPETRELRRVLGVAALAFWVAACLQQRGWSYHFLPAELCGAALIAVCAASALARPRAARFAVPALAGALLVGGLALAAQVAHSHSPRPSPVAGLAGIARDAAGGAPVLFLSTAVGPAFPVVNVSGASWASRMSCLWPLPGLYSRKEWASDPFAYRSRDEMGPAERALVDAVVEDLARWRPALIFVDRRRDRQAIGRSAFDFVAYFTRDPRFAALFAHYREAGDALSFRVYQRARTS